MNDRVTVYRATPFVLVRPHRHVPTFLGYRFSVRHSAQSSTETDIAVAAWEQAANPACDDRRGYVQAVASARYVMRKIIRIVDEVAREHGFDPLAHQALIQVYGVAGEPLAVSQLAERLDVVPAFASRLVRDLEQRGLVQRQRIDQDKRMARVIATPEAVPVLAAIDEQVRLRTGLLQRRLSDDQRQAALVALAFMVGVDSASPVGEALRTALHAVPDDRAPSPRPRRQRKRTPV